MNSLPIIGKSMTMILTLAILLSMVGNVKAQLDRGAPGEAVPTAPLQEQGPTDPAELEAFLDDLLSQEMEEYHIAGAAVSIVKNGRLFFAKGYGYTDLENKIPVDPYQTVFATGSVNKLFTWTAVMQLAEQGKPDLDDIIVNTHLHFDHCGGNHLFAGRPIYVQRLELDDARSKDDYTIREWVEAPGVRYVPVDGELELLPGLRLVPAPGHTHGLQVVVVETGGRPVVGGGDVAVWFGELDEPHTKGQLRVRALDPEVVWLAHEPWRPRHEA